MGTVQAFNERRLKQIIEVQKGGSLHFGGSKDDLAMEKNAKGSLASEMFSYPAALNDVDSWYSIMMSSLVGFLLNKFVKFQRPRKTGFLRELLTFFLFEVLSPRMSSYLPRPGLSDISTSRYAAGPISVATSRKLKAAGEDNLISKNWDWLLMFKEAGNNMPALLICMVIVDIGLGYKSDLMSFIHYFFVMLLVGVSRFAKNSVVVNKASRQAQIEIFRRTMLLGLSYETVPSITEHPDIDPFKSGFSGPQVSKQGATSIYPEPRSGTA